MTNKFQHHVFFLIALRTALIFIAGFLSYEMLKMVESEWNQTHPGNELSHIAHRKLYHFIIIFLIDLFIIYSIALLFDVHLC
jgi:hypothetical protein